MDVFVIILLSLLAVALTVYIFAMAPRLKKRNFKLPKVGYAHRGLWNEERPENSAAAFSAAVERGYGLETDVRLTKDKVPVLFHDDTLTRMCGDERRVIDCTYAELTELYLKKSTEKIPTLQDILEIAGGKVPLLIELKGEDMSTELCDVIAPMLDGYGDMLTVESFNPILLSRMKKLRPEMPRGQLITNLLKKGFPDGKVKAFMLTHLLAHFFSRPDFIAYDKAFPMDFSVWVCIKIFRAVPVIWTVNGKEEIKAFNGRGICPIFEEPEK